MAATFHVKHELAEIDKRSLWHPFTQMAEWEPLVIARGDGNYLIDIDGRRYLDGVSSLWCNVHGHNHPVLNAALTEQLARLAHSTFLGLTHEPGIRLAAELLDVTPPGLARVFFSDSGSTAVEVALKQSFQYWQLVGRPTKQRFLRLADAYHGDTLGAVGVGGIELFHRIFGPLLARSIAIPSPAQGNGERSLAHVREELERRAYEIAAFVVEPRVQGAAGMLVHPPGYLASITALCREHDVHLIVDEVATGFGRTGTLFACEHEAVSPDFLCLAKGISGGYLPLAATVSTERIFSAFLGRRSENRQFFHGHTYTGNPLACAVARASLALLQQATLAHARSVVGSLEAAAHRVGTRSGVREVRTCGLMIGIDLASVPDRARGAEVCRRARSYGVILRPLGDVVVWMPPLTITRADIELLEHATASAIEDTLP